MDHSPAEQSEDFASINRPDMIARGFTQFMEVDCELVRLYSDLKPGDQLPGLFPAIVGSRYFSPSAAVTASQVMRPALTFSPAANPGSMASASSPRSASSLR